MFRRRIGAHAIRHGLETGETIESCLNDTPYPSRLAPGWLGARPIHVVAADNPVANETIVISVYEPDPIPWEPDFRTRSRP